MYTTYERRQEIVIMLKDEKKISASILAHRLGVTVRTIRRDIDAISAYAPIYCNTGRNGGICLLNDDMT